MTIEVMLTVAILCRVVALARRDDRRPAAAGVLTTAARSLRRSRAA